MKSNNADTQSAAQAYAGEDRSDARRRLLLRMACGGALLLASLAAILMLSSCGQQGTHQIGSESQASTTEVQPAVSGPTTPSDGNVAASGAPVEGQNAVGAESQPPDLAVSVSETLVAPGEIVVIRAEGTSDVVEMILSDGIHDPRPFTYDSATKVWHVEYRMPLRPSERTGLSITARNADQRWRRRWVFLQVASPQTEVAPDSTEGGC